jgi:hypothetical protein
VALTEKTLDLRQKALLWKRHIWNGEGVQADGVCQEVMDALASNADPLRQALFDVTVRCTCEFRDCQYHHAARDLLGVSHQDDARGAIAKWDATRG